MNTDLRDLKPVPTIFVSLIQTVRVYSCFRAFSLFRQFEVKLKRYEVLLHILKAFLLLYYLWHLTACFWFFTNVSVEKEWANTWVNYVGLSMADSLAKEYLMSFYFVMNIVSTVGYGDMFALNDFERVVVILMINLADALFAVVFGLVAAISMRMQEQDEVKKFFDKMAQIEQFMEALRLDVSRKKVV